MARRRVWTTQPPPGTPIDWGNPLAQELRFALPGNSTMDAAGGRRLSYVGTQNPMVPVSQGISTYWNNDESAFVARDTQLEPPVASWAVFGQRAGGVNSYVRPLGKTWSNGTSAPYVSYDFEWNSGGTGQDAIATNISPNGSLYGTTPATFGNTQVPFTAVGTYDNQELILYFQGNAVASLGVSGPITYDTSSAGNLIVSGSSSAAAANQWNGYLFLCAVWGRPLQPQEVAQFNRNPWQIFHRRQRFYSIAASTGSVFTASPTMPDAIVAAQAALSIAASAAPTVPAGIAQASAALAITGSIAIAVPDGIVTAALSSGAVLTAALTAQRGIPQSSASLSIAATAAPTVPSALPAASAALSIALTGSATVPAGMARATAGTGSVFSVAIVAQTGAISATGALSIAATGTITAATPSVSARGALSIAGAVETTIPDAEARAAASTASGSVLSAALRMPTASPAIQAQLVVSANIAITVPDALVTAAGIIGSTPNPCMMVYLPARDFTITIPARAFTATLPTRKFTVTLKC